jgi:hypothetical protein
MLHSEASCDRILLLPCPASPLTCTSDASYPPRCCTCPQHEAKWDKAALTLFEEATQATSSSGSTGATTTQRQPDQDEPVSVQSHVKPWQH